MLAHRDKTDDVLLRWRDVFSARDVRRTVTDCGISTPISYSLFFPL